MAEAPKPPRKAKYLNPRTGTFWFASALMSLGGLDAAGLTEADVGAVVTYLSENTDLGGIAMIFVGGAILTFRAAIERVLVRIEDLIDEIRGNKDR